MSMKFPHFNPYMMGLMGGAQSFLAGLGSYFDAQRQHAAKLEEIHTKYDAMSDAYKAKAENQRLLSALKIEAGQRSYHIDTTDENGKPVRVFYRNTLIRKPERFRPMSSVRPVVCRTEAAGANYANDSERSPGCDGAMEPRYEVVG